MKDTEKTEPFADSVMAQLNEKYQPAKVIDTSGTRCPIPLLRAKKELKVLNVNEYLLVLATDPSAKGDFDAMLKHLPHSLVDYQSVAGQSKVDYFVIQKCA